MIHNRRILVFLSVLIVEAMKHDFINGTRRTWESQFIDRGIESAGGEHISGQGEEEEPPRKRRKILYREPSSWFVQQLTDTMRFLLFRLWKNKRKGCDWMDKKYVSSADKIGQWWVRVKKWRPNANGVESTLEREGAVMSYKGKICTCPFTLCPIPVDDSVKLRAPTGHVAVYTLSELVKYFKRTKDFRCPILRYEFTRDQVKHVACRALENGIKTFGLMNLYDNQEKFRDEQDEREHAVTGLARVCADVLASCLDVAGDPNYEDRYEALDEVNGEILPEWRAHVRALYGLDRDTCVAMLEVEKERLERLKGKIVDHYGILPIVCGSIAREIKLYNRLGRAAPFGLGMGGMCMEQMSSPMGAGPPVPPMFERMRELSHPLLSSVPVTVPIEVGHPPGPSSPLQASYQDTGETMPREPQRMAPGLSFRGFLAQLSNQRGRSPHSGPRLRRRDAASPPPSRFRHEPLPAAL